METVVSLFDSLAEEQKTRQILHIEMLVQRKCLGFFLNSLRGWGWGLRGGRRRVVVYAVCCLRELFILRVHSLWRSERRRPYSSYSACR